MAEIAEGLSGIVPLDCADRGAMLPTKRRLIMQSLTLPTLDAGEIMAHDPTCIVGQVVETIYPADNKPDAFEQVLLLPDGTRQNFRLVDLHPANEFERRRYVQAVIE